MRTTLSLDDDAIEIAKMLSRRRRISLGKAVSELVRKAARQPVMTEARGDFQIVSLPPGSPAVAASRVDDLLQDLP